MSKLIGLSLSRARMMLFEPFSPRKWLWLTLIAFLAGALGAGWSGTRNIGRAANMRKSAAGKISAQATGGGAGAAATGAVETQAPPAEGKPFRDKLRRAWDRVRNFARLHKALVAAAVGAAAFFFLFFLWLGARFQFVWLNAVMKNTTEIAGPFDDFARQGNSLFGFSLTISAAWFLLLFGVGRWVFLAAKAAKMFEAGHAWSAGEILQLFLPRVGVLGVGVVFLVLLSFCAHQFVTPIMALGETSLVPAFGTWLGIAWKRAGAFVLYFVTWLALKIAAIILTVILGFAVMLAFLVIGAILFGIVYLVLSVGFKLKALFLAVAVVLGIPFVLLMMVTSLAVRLPFAVFFQSFALYFLTSLDCGYEPLPLRDESENIVI